MPSQDVCPSVSVTRQYSVNTAEYMLHSFYRQVAFYQTVRHCSDWDPP